MTAMRAAAFAALLLVLAGCGSAASQTSSTLGSDAASLVPSNAEAFVDVDTHFDSQQWQALADLAGPKLDLARLKAAAGDALSLAVLQDGTPVAFAKTHDEAKLRRLATSFDKGGEHYTVQSISGWSVVADSQQAFAQVKATGSGKSLADNASFRAAEATLNGNSLATAFLNGQELKELGQAKWFAARVTGDANALQLDVHAESLTPAPGVYKPMLLRDVPSGARTVAEIPAAALSPSRISTSRLRSCTAPTVTSACPWRSCCRRCAGRASSTCCRERSCRRSYSRFRARIRPPPRRHCTPSPRRSSSTPEERSPCASRGTARASS